MSIKEIAEKLVAYCRKGDFAGAQKELYADDALSLELYATPEFEKETQGLPAILVKGDKFESLVEEMHLLEISDPIIASNSFALTMRMDMTMKGQGRMDMTELCVYKVKDGKIVEESFLM